MEKLFSECFYITQWISKEESSVKKKNKTTFTPPSLARSFTHPLMFKSYQSLSATLHTLSFSIFITLSGGYYYWES